MSNSDKKIVTRFAPSPTGLLHLGSYRTAIFAYLFAKKNGGKFILRIEDTDKERSKKEYEENILESLKWLGINSDEFYRQSENLPRHKFYLEKLIAEGNAYVSKEPAKDGSGVIKEIIRFKNPNISVTFSDEIKGNITVDTTDLGDFVIAKNMEEPLFHIAVVVDDFEEGVTHVIRGEDHVSNTPRQILIQRAIGAPQPIYAHLPLVLGEDRLKLSKRRGALSVFDYKKIGYLPEAVLNGTVFIGWNPGTEKEIFTPEELMMEFSLEKVQKSPAAFNPEKFLWFNKEHLKTKSDGYFVEKIKESLPSKFNNKEDVLKKIAPIVKERIFTLGDIQTMFTAGELDYFFESPKISKESLLCPEKLRKGKEVSSDDVKKHLEKVEKMLEQISEEKWNNESVKVAVWDYATEEGRGVVLWAMRYALSGLEKSPDPFTLADILGKKETVRRVRDAMAL